MFLIEALDWLQILRTYRKMSSKRSGLVVSVPEAKRFVEKIFKKVGVGRENSATMAEVLVAADIRGEWGNGLNRIAVYVQDIRSGSCSHDAVPVILKESSSTAWVDGRNGLGPVIGNFCMELAINKARRTGFSWVTAKGCSHNGMASWYSSLALKHGLVGLTFGNTPPVMAPTRAKEAVLGFSPISIAAPVLSSDDLIFDMTATAVSVGKIHEHHKKGLPLDEGWALGPDGKTTTDPAAALQAKCLMPLGGTSGYKGYGLALAVETLSAILAGALFGPKVRPWISRDDTPAGLGQSYVVIDPGFFAPGFGERMAKLLDNLRNLEPMDSDRPVMVPGDKEMSRSKKVVKDGGILYDVVQIRAMNNFAKSLGVPPLKILE